MAKYPNIVKLRDLFDFDARTTRLVGGLWVPARSLGYPSLANRFRAAWLVFTGRADAVIWPEDEEDNRG